MKKKNKWLNPFHWLSHKGWFFYDLPYFIYENQWIKGVELGAKSGRSMFYMLKHNKELHLSGIDKWQVIEGGAYKRNPLNELRCKRRLKRFQERADLIHEDALVAAGFFEDDSLDFVHYDLQCKPMLGKHGEMIAKWTVKIKDGGVLIGRDFRDFRDSFYRLGYEENEIFKCKIKGRFSRRLEYLVVKKSY
mgnify:CR=1 FL=1